MTPLIQRNHAYFLRKKQITPIEKGVLLLSILIYED